ncbi:MAG: GNAT family N-acetyltransferase [Candidatus Thiodiazotropha sp.]
MCTIRIANVSDIERIVVLMAAFYKESGYMFDNDNAYTAFDALLKNDSLGKCWLIECDSDPVGYIAVTYTFSLEYFGHAAFIEDLYVSPEYRNRGLGLRALEAAEKECRKRGILALHLEVGSDNIAGNALYESFGFNATDRKLLNKRLSET